MCRFQHIMCRQLSHRDGLDSEKLHDNLRTNTMKTLIPKEHKQTYGESFSRFFNDGFQWVKPHISPYNYVWRTNYVQYTFITLYNSRACTQSSLGNHSPKRRGYCDTAVRTGTSGTGAVRTQCVHTPGQPVPYSGVCFQQFHMFKFHSLRKPHINSLIPEFPLLFATTSYSI